MPNNFDVNLRLLLDEAAFARVKAGVSTIDEEVKKLTKGFDKLSLGELVKLDNTKLEEALKLYGEIAKANQDITGSTSEGVRAGALQLEQTRRMRQEAKKTREEEVAASGYKRLSSEDQRAQSVKEYLEIIRKSRPLLDEYNKLSKEGRSSEEQDWKNITSVLLRHNEILEEAEKTEKKTQKQKNIAFSKEKKARQDQIQDVRQISTLASRSAADLNRFGTSLVVSGTAITGGIIAAANKYAKEAGNATEATARWNEELAEQGKQRSRISQTFVRETLPIIEAGTKALTLVADFIETNPSLVQTALKAGAVLIGVGTLTKIFASGLKLVADITYISASVSNLLAGKTMKEASREFLVSAGLMKRGVAGKGLAGAGSLAGSTSITAIASSVIGVLAAIGGGVAVGALLNDALAKAGFKGFIKSNQFATGAAYQAGTNVYGKLSGLDDAEIKRKSIVFAAIIGKLTGAIDESSPLWLKATSSIEKTADALGKVVGSLSEGDVVKAFTAWKEEDARIVRDAMTERAKITKAAEDETLASNRAYITRVSQITSEAASESSKLAKGYAANMKKAETAYANDRAGIVADSNDAVRKIEEDHQERMRKMVEDHNERVAGLVDDRDALGLVKEERRFNAERSEAEKGIQESIRREHQETAARLQELASRYAQERAQRQAEYIAAQAEVAANRAAALKEAQAQHNAELKQIREAKAQQLLELDKSLREERIRARDNFIGSIRDLDASLLGERNLKKQYYNVMLADAEKFMSDWRKGITSGVTSSGGSSMSTSSGGTSAFLSFTNSLANIFAKRDDGGYATKGLYRMAWDGKKEFVMSGQTTRAAEQALGSQLSQDNMLQALSLYGQARQGLSYNDNRRFNSGISAKDRRAIRQDTYDVVSQLMKGVMK